MNFQAITPELVRTPAVASSDFLKGLCEFTMGVYPPSGPPVPWTGYLAEEGGEFVGSCAFKSAPVDGQVEIAYFTFPEHEGRGIATRMAQHLVEIAVAGGVRTIRAQTLPQESASTSILRRLGFDLVGTVTHPEDGQVWEWHKPGAA